MVQLFEGSGFITPANGTAYVLAAFPELGDIGIRLLDAANRVHYDKRSVPKGTAGAQHFSMA